MPLPTMTEKKRAITVIMQRMGGGSESGGTGYKKEGESGDKKPRSDASAAKSGAMHRFMTAIKTENPDEMADALENFLELCESSGEEEESSEPVDEETT